MICALAVGALWMAAETTQPLMADTSRVPHVTVSWETGEGKSVKFEGDRGYKSPGEKAPLGANLDCYVMLGGSRVEKGLGDPHGVTIRVGLEKKDPKRPFFEGITEGGMITIRLDHAWMNQSVEARPKTGLLRSRYLLSDLAACGIDATGRSQYCTVDPDDPIKPLVKPENGRFGSLDGTGADHGSLETKVEADGSVTMTFKFPYTLLKHVKDPNLRTKPGTFFEPQMLHVEMEVVAAGNEAK